MIIAEFVCDEEGQLAGFTVRNHGASHVCAAVSLLVLNTVNSIEALTDEAFDCDHAEDGGFIKFAVKGPRGSKSGILLDAMALGLSSIQERYPQEIQVTVK